MKFFTLLLAIFFTVTAHAEIQLPDGFRISVFAHVPEARTMVGVPELGVVFIGTRTKAVYAVLDQDQDGVSEKVLKLGDNLKVPNALSWKDGYLYVTEQHRLTRYRIGDKLPKRLPKPEILYSDLPDKRWHGWRYSSFGPDGGLYVAVGAPCNICWLKDPEGTILRFDPQSWVPVVFARGIRNSVGLAFHPITGDLYFTDNGADNMGDNRPPDELNRAPVGGLHFGYPYFGGGSERTSEFQDETPPQNRKPVFEFPAHVAPLGIEFYTGTRFPHSYQNGIFVAQHGSWNRSDLVGYHVSFIPFDERGNLTKREENFATGWLTAESHVMGRPVDLEQWADGRMLISDDYDGTIYIVDYHK